MPSEKAGSRRKRVLAQSQLLMTSQSRITSLLLVVSGIADVEDDGEPFEEKMARITGELSKCFEESNRLQEQIKKNLEAIGYEM